MFTLYDDDNDKREIEDIDVVRHEYGGNRFAWDPQKALPFRPFFYDLGKSFRLP